MRYLESREESAEILRLSLALMSKQEAAFHPTSYALWYEHIAGINPRLTGVLTARLAAQASLTNEDVWRLHAQYVIARDIDAFERIQQQLCTLLDDTSRIAMSTSAEASQFGQVLEGRQSQLVNPLTIEVVRDIVADLLTDTERMRAVTAELSQRLEANAREVQSLSAQLDQAQNEALVDPLTGLNNRRGFERRVDDISPGETPLLGAALLLTDIDLFKTINDTHGHLLGDKVLRAVAEILRQYQGTRCRGALGR